MTGGWSIGNEFVYYSLFPILIVALRRPFGSIFILSLALLSWIYYGFFHISPNTGIVEQWIKYINPFNNLLFFVSGVLIAKVILYRVGFMPKTGALIAVLSLVLFTTVEVSHYSIDLVTGAGRAWLTLLSISLFAGIMLLGNLPKNNKIISTLDKLGDISYSLYIIHGITYYYILKLVGSNFDKIGKLELCFIVFVASIAFAWLVSSLVEKPFIKASKIISNKIQGSIIKEGAIN